MELALIPLSIALGSLLHWKQQQRLTAISLTIRRRVLGVRPEAA